VSGRSPWGSRHDGWVCTVVLSLEPGERMPLVLLGVRDELVGRPWRPPARHWPGSPLIGGIDEQAGGTWLAVHPDIPRVACLLNGRGTQADPARRRSRGELPLRAATDGAGVLKELADDPAALRAYDPFYLVCAVSDAVTLLSWDGATASMRDLAPGTHLLTNAGHAFPPDPSHPDDPAAEPKSLYFAPKFAAARPSADPALPVAQAWGDWLALARGDDRDPADPGAIIARRDLPDGQVWGSTSVTLVALAPDAIRYDFQASPGGKGGWYPVVTALSRDVGGYRACMPKARIAAIAACVTALAGAAVVAAPVAPAVSALSAARPGASAAAAELPRIVITPGAIRLPGAARQQPLTTAQCEQTAEIACYSPGQLRTAYHLPAVYAKGITGKGETIVIVDSFGSPTIKSDLTTFDRHYGYPAPPAFKIITPAGKIPAFTDNADMSGWAGETTLDVEYAHSLAPGASILLVETPVSETEGVTGFPQIVKAEEYVINHHLGAVISQSFSATEETFKNYAQLKPLRAAILDADSHNVTVLAASGDAGASDYELNGSDYYTRRVTSWPDSDPLVTGVGGTQLKQSGGSYTSVAWNDTTNRGADEYWGGSTDPDPLASGGGKSEFFARPSYQNAVKSVTGASRGVPDISMSAACNGAVNIYSSFTPGDPGWSLTCGTSEATPEFAAIVALADQVAKRPLGLLNPTLYKLLAERAPGLVDVTSGNNTVSFYQGTATKPHKVTGYQARKGYDLVTGVGTVNASKLVYELAGVPVP
jgi:Transport and Golgi organisation 2/Subtilase family